MFAPLNATVLPFATSKHRSHAVQVEQLHKEGEQEIDIGSCQFLREGYHQEPAKEVSLPIARHPCWLYWLRRE